MLIAESGSTKTEWRLCRDGKQVLSFRSQGFNPNVQTPDAMEEELRRAYNLNMIEPEDDVLFFYGAGIDSHGQRQIMEEVLRKIFGKIRIEVNSDMLAAARATNRTEGIVCILGTGSNSCAHKDHQITEKIGGHGWVFGDEGSGADLGKHLIKMMLQNDLPQDIIHEIEDKAGKPAFALKISVMQSSKPNVRLANLGETVGAFIHVPQVREMVYQRMLAFLDTTVCRYPGYQDQYADFVGSISHYFHDILAEACAQRSVRLGNVLQAPIDTLVDFHLSNTL